MNAADLANMPAFPLPLGTCNMPEASSGGMTLRQHYAGLALQGYAATDIKGLPDPDRVASLAVAAADCLIAELAKPVAP